MGGGFSFLNGKKYGYIYIVQLDKSYSLERWGAPAPAWSPPFLYATANGSSYTCSLIPIFTSWYPWMCRQVWYSSSCCKYLDCSQWWLLHAFFFYPSGVTLDLQPESEMVAESAGVVEVCVSLSGELETSVNAMVFIVSGDATGAWGCLIGCWTHLQRTEKLLHVLLYLLVNYKNFLSQVESVLLLYVLCADDDDFSFETGMGSIVLTFTESEEQCINISIAMDNLLEASEHFSVVMGSRDDRVKLNNRISQIYIIDSGSEFMQRTHAPVSTIIITYA